MSVEKHRDLRFPLNNDAVRKLSGMALGRWFTYMAALGSAPDLRMEGPCGNIMEQERTLDALFVVLPTAMASGESMVVDVQKSTNGGGTWATVLSATKTLNSTTATAAIILSQIDLTSLVLTASKRLATGTMLRAVCTYVAGGTPTGTAMAIVAECSSPLAD